MLKENDVIRERLIPKAWEEYDGTGVNILLLDWNGKILDYMKLYTVLVDPEGKMIDEEKHNTYTMQIIHEFAPGAMIYVCPWNFSKKEIEAYVRSKPHGFFDLANVSIGSPKSDVYNFLLDQGIVTTCSAGNDGDQDENGVDFPANLPWTIAVGAEGKSYSNGGKVLNCVAPTDITVLRGNGTKTKYGGTSSSNPVANALLARYIHWQKKNGQPKLLPYDSVKLVNQISVDVGKEGFDLETGYGLLCLPETLPTQPESPKEGEHMDKPGIKWIGSPNFSSASAKQKTVAIVDHIMSGTLAGTDSWFLNPESMASSHFGVGKNGEIHQYVSLDNPAWANGVVTKPNWPLYTGVNPNYYTVSIEHEGYAGDVMPEAQYQATLALHRWIIDLLGIVPGPDTIIGHYRIDSINKANCPGPGFPWERLLRDLKGETDVLEVAILKHSSEDEWAAKDIDAYLGGVANFTRQGDTRIIPAAALKAKKLIIIGGPDVPEHPNRIYLSGQTKYDTAAAVGKYLG